MTNTYYHIATQLAEIPATNRNGWSSLVKATDWDVLRNEVGDVYASGTYARGWYTRYNGVKKKPKDIRATGFRFGLPKDATPTRIYLNVRMRIVENIDVPVPSVRFGLIPPEPKNWNNASGTHGTGWHNGVYVDAQPLRSGNREKTMSRAWWLFNYEIPVWEFIQQGYSAETFNDWNPTIDLQFRDAITGGSYSCEFQLGYIYMSLEYVQPKHNISFIPSKEYPLTGETWEVDAIYTQSEPFSFHGGITKYKLSPQWTQTIESATWDSGSHYDAENQEWYVNSIGSQEHKLHLTLKSHMAGDNALVFNSEDKSSFVYRTSLGYGVDDGFDDLKISLIDEIYHSGKGCAIVSIEGYSHNATNRYQASLNGGDDFKALGWEVYDVTNGVSIDSQSEDKKTVTLKVTPNERFTAYLKFCFIPYVSGNSTLTVDALDTGNSGSVDFNILEGIEYIVSSNRKADTNKKIQIYCPTHTIRLRQNRILTDTLESQVNILPFKADDGDALMTISPISFHLNKLEDLDYIGCVPLEQTHFEPKSTYKDTLINTSYKNKRYMGKKLASDEDITLNVRLHPHDVTTIQGLIDMDKPIPINTNHKSFEGDSLNHRGWAEIYSIKTEETNPHWYKCDIDVKYLTHNLNTRLNIERGNKTSDYPVSDSMIYVFNKGDSLSTDGDNFFKVVTDGTYTYYDTYDESLANEFKLNNGEHLVVSSKRKLANVTSFEFEWASILQNEYKENNIARLVKLVDKDGNSAFEYEYTDYEVVYHDDEVDKIIVNVVYRIRTETGWENVNKSIKLRGKLFDDTGLIVGADYDEHDSPIHQVFGSTLRLDLNNNKLKIIDEGFNGRELYTENAIDLIGDDYYFVTEWKNNNGDAETSDCVSYFSFGVEETILYSEFATKYAKSVVSPFPVAKKHLLFTRDSEEGVLYYYEDDGEEFSYMIEPYYQYMCGTDLKSSDGISIFNLNYGYEVVYIQNGLVRMGFNRINGQVYLAKYDTSTHNYHNTHNFQLEKYSDINVKSISDDKIEIQASDTIFTIWRGHPYVMINHPTEDILIDTKFSRVWAEGVGSVTPSEYPEYWDLQNTSNLLPSCIGGTQELKTSCVDVEEVDNTDRTDVAGLEWASTNHETHINDWNNIYVGQPMNFRIDGQIQVPQEYITADGYKSIFGNYTFVTEINHSILDSILVGTNKNVVVRNGTADVTARALDYGGVGIADRLLYFYEKYTPMTIVIPSTQKTVLKGQNLDITTILKDDDGSGIQGEEVYFYEKSLLHNLDVLTDTTVMKNNTLDVRAKLTNEYQQGIRNEPIFFYEKYTTDSIHITSPNVSIAKNSTVDITAQLKDEDGSGINNELVYFYEKYNVYYLRIYAPTTESVINQPIEFVGYLGDDDGSAIKGDTIGFDVLAPNSNEWQRIETKITNDNGNASTTYTPTVSGIHQFRVFKGIGSTPISITVDEVPLVRAIVITGDDVVGSGDTLSLTATAYDENNDPIQNATLSVYQDGVSQGTITTGSGGTATYNYTGTGIGDTVFTMSADSVSSAPFVVEDCIIYSTNSYELTPNSALTQISDFAFANTGDWEVSWIHNMPSSSCRVALYPSTDSSKFLGIGVDGSGKERIYDNNTDSAYSNFSYNTDYLIIMKKQGNSISITSRNTFLKNSTNANILSAQNINIGVRNWGSGRGTIKNIKVKSLQNN